MLSVTLSERTHALLQQCANKSDYVDAVLAHYPPPPMDDPMDVAELIQSKHPCVIDPETGLARDRLPTFGGKRPADGPHGSAATWSQNLVVSRNGVVWTRKKWETDAILAASPCIYE